ncbi:MAG TPA: hypothetical protein VNU94_08075 [Acidobacteriaceae bacterium]|nr:hypothetical protein [Acidobacteriaceae bacterium]
MPTETSRILQPMTEAEVLYSRWLKQLNDEFTRHQGYERRCDIVRDELFQLFRGKQHGGRTQAVLQSEMSTNVIEATLDPRNVTLEAEYLEGIDRERYLDRKPLIYMWQMFDRSPLGLNLWLGFKFRCMMARHIFQSVGSRIKIHHVVHFHFGYNITLQDDIVIHRGATLDDRAPFVLKTGTHVPAFATVGGETGHAKEYEY